MGSSTKLAGGIAATVLSGAALAAQAQSAAAGGHFVRVPCSASALSTAVIAANNIPATLRLAPRCNYRITGTLTVSGTVTLLGGPSTSIRPAKSPTSFSGRLLDVSNTGKLRVEGIAILSGNGNSGESGVGIRNAGNLVLNYVTLGGNTANNGNGAGLYNLPSANALIAHSLVSENKAVGTGAAGGILNDGNLTFFGSRLSANTSADGAGGIDTRAGGTSRFIQSTVDHNLAGGGDGGGMFNFNGTTSLDRTLVVRNRATGTGGGIFTTGGTVKVTRSIIRNNIPDNCAHAPATPAIPGCTG